MLCYNVSVYDNEQIVPSVGCYAYSNHHRGGVDMFTG